MAKEVSVEHWLLEKVKLLEEMREIFKHNMRRGKIKSGIHRHYLLNLTHPLHFYLFKPPGFHVSSPEQSRSLCLCTLVILADEAGTLHLLAFRPH